ncbi:hypothetical protein G7Z17_g1130 [Cylindrodendrum hubeiense]|uniref:Velvet domain-containing protein n=1 Tax=Cylindrodendrum hubeiense TaxID=595255 RepID=A0A9P5HFH6_9HYPO|nr:hypothetical protein G7Z17_g1130 [Cylindrodendrum hubeiense]
MPSLSIAVQPPQEVQVGQTLYPSVIAKMTSRSSNERYYFFSMAVLLGHNGVVIEEVLVGTTVSTGVVVGSSVVFLFPGLSIATQGVYKIRLDVYKVAYEDPNGAAFYTQTETRGISVLETAVHHSKPSSAERVYIRTLRDAGIPVPSRSS